MSLNGKCSKQKCLLYWCNVVVFSAMNSVFTFPSGTFANLTSMHLQTDWFSNLQHGSCSKQRHLHLFLSSNVIPLALYRVLFFIVNFLYKQVNSPVKIWKLCMLPWIWILLSQEEEQQEEGNEVVWQFIDCTEITAVRDGSWQDLSTPSLPQLQIHKHRLWRTTRLREFL